MKNKLKIFGLSAVALAALTVSTGTVDVDAAETTYTVKSGDTLFEIAAEFFGNGWKYDEIADANGISNPNVIHVGQQLTFDDGKGGAVAATPAPEVHTEVDTAPAVPKVKEEVKETAPVQQSSQASSSVPEYVLKVVESEAGPSYEEKSKVFSVIVNRVNSGKWGGSDYMSVVKAPGQFQVTWTGAADRTTVSNETRQAVADVLNNGVTTNAESFRASGDGVTNVFR